ncbi:unnamed protein product [Brachionus calyciflorus]|uniref:Uncharacterized protein n=1 Tax=Brachionus calyciflorus TaxID=104777 RepID=A0A813Z4U6_9BILA|nr:unnamed protein product [Brachionus calyciflorus]
MEANVFSKLYGKKSKTTSHTHISQYPQSNEWSSPSEEITLFDHIFGTPSKSFTANERQSNKTLPVPFFDNSKEENTQQKTLFEQLFDYDFSRPRSQNISPGSTSPIKLTEKYSDNNLSKITRENLNLTSPVKMSSVASRPITNVQPLMFNRPLVTDKTEELNWKSSAETSIEEIKEKKLPIHYVDHEPVVKISEPVLIEEAEINATQLDGENTNVVSNSLTKIATLSQFSTICLESISKFQEPEKQIRSISFDKSINTESFGNTNENENKINNFGDVKVEKIKEQKLSKSDISNKFKKRVLIISLVVGFVLLFMLLAGLLSGLIINLNNSSKNNSSVTQIYYLYTNQAKMFRLYTKPVLNESSKT